MGFKGRIFGGNLILCVLLILDTQNIVRGCKLIRPDGTEVELDGLVKYEGDGKIADNESPGLLYNYTTEDVTNISKVSGTYLEYKFNGVNLEVLLSDNYKNWEENEIDSTLLTIDLDVYCSPEVVSRVVFVAEITTFTNGYAPVFSETSYNIKLPMPLPAGYTIFGECGEVIEVTDYDYNDQYKSSVEFSLDDTTDFQVTSSKSEGRKWAVILKTTNTFRIEAPQTVTLVAKDVDPDGSSDSGFERKVNITIEPDIDASTPATPLFEKPIYILDIRQEEDINPIEATLEEGGTVAYEVELLYSNGENLKEFFDIYINGPIVTLTPNKSIASTEFSGNFGVLILEAKQTGTSQIGKTVIHVTLPGNYVTTPPSTTETTALPCSCPTEETTYTADTTTPSEEVTECPEVTTSRDVTSADTMEPSEEITQCPEVTCPTEVTCSDVTSATEPTVLQCTCPTEETTLISDTTKPTDEDTTKPTDGSTYITETTTPTEESTQCPEVTCTPETTILSCTCPPTTYCPTAESTITSLSTSDESSTATATTTTIGDTNTCEPCDCSSETPESSTDEGSTATTTTTIGDTNTCEPCDCSCGTPESSTAFPQEERIYFTDPKAIVYIYEQQVGYIKTMSAYCQPACKIEYNIVYGPLSSSLYIDHDTGDINITQNIMESGPFDVMAIAEIDGKKYNETATVTLSVMTLRPCQNGSEWVNTLTVKSVKEELSSKYIVENCGYKEGCECAIVKVIPETARDYFTAGTEIVLNKSIDREDEALFPDQSDTNIILHLELSCEDNVKTIHKFWDKRSRSEIDDIGTIEYNASRTVIVLRIEDINDNRPTFNITSPLTVGYPTAEIAGQLLPPYLTKIQATDIDFGENAKIKYRLTPDDQFFIHEETGVIYPIAGAFKYEDTQFTVNASDSEGDGVPLEVNIVTLSPDNLMVVRQEGSVLEDVDDVIERITSVTSCSIKLLSSAVIASDTVHNDAFNKKVDDRQLPNFKSMKESKNSLLQLVIYGLDDQKKPVSYSDIKKNLEGVTDFTLESWTTSNSSASSASSDTGLLIGVIVLAVIILLLLGSAGVAYLLYIRSRRNNNNDYYDNILNGSGRSSVSQVDEKGVPPVIEEEYDYVTVQPSSNMEVIQPSAPPLLHLSTTKPDKELVNNIEPDKINQETTDLKNTASNGDDGENKDGSNFENIKTRRKSVVTFNDNVERIEIEEV